MVRDLFLLKSCQKNPAIIFVERQKYPSLTFSLHCRFNTLNIWFSLCRKTVNRQIEERIKENANI